jgi:hypothetical protein
MGVAIMSAGTLMRHCAILTVSCAGALVGCESTDSSLPQWTFVHELSIGNESSPEYALTRVQSIRIDSAGSMYVVHPQDGRIRVFDRNGQFLRYIGRRGEGPGEFDRLLQAGLRGDTVWAADATSLARFTLNGELIRDDPIRYATPSEQFRASGIDYVLPDGSYAVVPSWLPSRDEADWPSGVPLFAINANGVLTHDIGEFDLEPLRMFRMPDGTRGMAFIPFLPLFPYSRAPDGSSFVFVRQRPATSDAPATFRVVKVTFAGDTTFARDVDYEPILVQQAAQDSVLRAVTGEGDNRRPADVVRARMEAAPIPEYYPPVKAILQGSDGSTWLQMQGPPTGEWLVLGTDGTPLAQTRGPVELQLLAVDANRAWGFELDAYDVPSVVRYRIVK